jgi:hypothetical protein
MKNIKYLSLVLFVYIQMANSNKIDRRYDETLKHLKDREGFATVGYLPTTSSGVTIGIGIDLGQQTKTGLQSRGISSSIISKLEKYLGFKSKAQLDAAKLTPSNLVLTQSEAESLSKPFILESYDAVAPYAVNLDDKGNAVLVSLRHWCGSLGCSNCKLSILVNGVDTNYLWNEIKGKTARNEQIKQALMKTLQGKLPIGSATYNRIKHEINYLG